MDTRATSSGMSGIFIARHAAKKTSANASLRFLAFFTKWATTYKTKHLEITSALAASELV